MEPLSNYHEIIDLPGMENEYLSKKDQVRQGALRAHLASIRNLTLVTASTKEPFNKDFFTTRAIEIYMTLCRVFGEDEQNFVPIKFMYMMTQISSFSVDIIFDFTSYIVEEIHIGLNGIAKIKVEKTFGHYSLLMYMFLFKGVTYF